MIQINEYNLETLDSELDKKVKAIDNLIKADLKKISKIRITDSFFRDLEKVVDIESDFSFIKASINQVDQLKYINTSINIKNLKPFNEKFKSLALYLKHKRKDKCCMLNDILEFIFGYHIEERTQILKRILKNINFHNCVYCLAQYTTSYGIDKQKIYVKGNLDHIYPKSLNSLVSLSLNNLVPVCAHCNQRKLHADLSKFNFNPFAIIKLEETPTFQFKDVLKIDRGTVELKNLNDLKIENINPTLESRLELTSLYKEYQYPIENLLERFNKFNSLSYQEIIKKVVGKITSENLEYFISEIPYSEDNLQNVPLHKFKNDFYKELEEYKKSGEIKFS